MTSDGTDNNGLAASAGWSNCAVGRGPQRRCEDHGCSPCGLHRHRCTLSATTSTHVCARVVGGPCPSLDRCLGPAVYAAPVSLAASRGDRNGDSRSRWCCHHGRPQRQGGEPTMPAASSADLRCGEVTQRHKSAGYAECGCKHTRADDTYGQLARWWSRLVMPRLTAVAWGDGNLGIWG